MNTQMEMRRILRINGEQQELLEDPVVREVPLTIYLNGQEFVTLLYTPELPEMLAVGFLRSEGLIRAFDDITSLRYDEEQSFIFVETQGSKLPEKLYGKRTITSGCGKGTVFYSVLDALKSNPVESDFTLSVQQVLQLMKELQLRAELFRLTGGLHSAALCSAEKILYFCEDIGRHNAVDKLVGLCLKHEISLTDKVLVSSGRISSEILVKAAKLGIPILISRAAPTSLSIELAESLVITLIGFVRGRRCNIYTHQERVLV